MKNRGEGWEETMILTVTLNTAIDKRYVVQRFQPGEVNRVKSCINTPGGKGINVSKVAAIAGEEVTATGFLGGHSGEFIENALKPFGIRSAFYHLKEETRSCINIWDEEKQIQTELLEPGFCVTREMFGEFLAQYTKLAEQAAIVVLSGSAPQGLDNTVYQSLIRAAKNAGKQVILDTGGSLLEQGIQACPTLIKPNLDEIRMLTGKDCENWNDMVEAAKRIQAGGVETIVVSLGENGSFVLHGSVLYRAKVPKIAAVNTVGCGDSMIAGFAIGMTKKLPTEETLRIASAISAASALREETGLFLPEDMEKLLPEIEITRSAI
jgi:tagatose 6-phosphate kinase